MGVFGSPTRPPSAPWQPNPQRIMIYPVENGFSIKTGEGKLYVAEDVEKLCDTIKLIMVNRKMNNAPAAYGQSGDEVPF